MVLDARQDETGRDGPLDIEAVEAELRKRLAYPYRWGGKQTDRLDQLTAFVYNIPQFGVLEERLDALAGHADIDAIRRYAMNRWYNYWSAQAVEAMFCTLPGVRAEQNGKHKRIDFYIGDINFDLKTTVFPRGYRNSPQHAMEHPKELIYWLYDNQSREGRFHTDNRLFVVLLNRADAHAHWKLKTELGLIRREVKAYLGDFRPERLQELWFRQGGKALSDVIWVVQD